MLMALHQQVGHAYTDISDVLHLNVWKGRPKTPQK